MFAVNLRVKKLLDNKTLTYNDLKLLKEKYPDTYEEQINKVENGYPVQYLIGHVDFLNTNILVNENVLVPRFETEYLVEKVITKLKNKPNLKILDIGTGSGCIAIALKKNLNAQVEALDISEKALKLAKKNAFQNNVEINFLKKDILNTTILDTYDVYISNPPYLASDSKVDEFTKHEPFMALYANHEGLEFYEKIIALISYKPVLIAFEIGENQAKEICKLAQNKFPEAKISIEKDLTGKDRYIFIEH